MPTPQNFRKALKYRLQADRELGIDPFEFMRGLLRDMIDHSAASPLHKLDLADGSFFDKFSDTYTQTILSEKDES